MLPEIKLKHLDKIIQLRKEQQSQYYHKDKINYLSLAIDKMAEEEVWLLTFAIWFCEVNTRWTTLDTSKYFALPPAKKQKSKFSDFISVVNKFNRKRATAKREKPLIDFLLGCNEIYLELYLQLFSCEYSKPFPMQEIHKVLDMSVIDLQDVYGPIEILQTSFSELNYPVAIHAIPNPDMPFSVLFKDPGKRGFLQMTEEGFKQSKSTLFQTMKYINAPSYTLVGYTEATAKEKAPFYPIDYFPFLSVYRSYQKRGKKPLPFIERMDELNRFLSENLLTKIVPNYSGLAEKEADVIPEILKVMEGSKCNYVMFTDESSARTGKGHAVAVCNTKAIIEKLWIEEDEVKGFWCWFNCQLLPVSFSFDGLNNALLNNISYLHRKPIRFTYICVGDMKVGIGKEILAEEKPWKPKPIKGVMVEKCIFCGGNEFKHRLRGVCKCCERHLSINMGTIGEWHTVGTRIARRRVQSGWDNYGSTLVDFNLFGYLLEVREDGCWRFIENEEVMKQHEKNKAIYSRGGSVFDKKQDRT